MKVLLWMVGGTVVLATAVLALPVERALTPVEAAAVQGGCFDNSTCNTNVGTCFQLNYFSLTHCPDIFCTTCEHDTEMVQGCEGAGSGNKCRYKTEEDPVDCGCLQVGTCQFGVCNDAFGCDEEGAQCADKTKCESKSGSCPY